MRARKDNIADEFDTSPNRMGESPVWDTDDKEDPGTFVTWILWRFEK